MRERVFSSSRLRGSLIWLAKCQEGRVIFFPVFHGFLFLLISEWPAGWAGAASTTVDHADMRESTPLRRAVVI